MKFHIHINAEAALRLGIDPTVLTCEEHVRELGSEIRAFLEQEVHDFQSNKRDAEHVLFAPNKDDSVRVNARWALPALDDVMKHGLTALDILHAIFQYKLEDQRKRAERAEEEAASREAYIEEEVLRCLEIPTDKWVKGGTPKASRNSDGSVGFYWFHCDRPQVSIPSSYVRRDDPRIAAKIAAAEELLPALQVEGEARATRCLLSNEKDVAEKTAAAEERKRKREEWIAQNGSDHLKLLLEKGFGYLATYYDEWYEKEYPEFEKIGVEDFDPESDAWQPADSDVLPTVLEAWISQGGADRCEIWRHEEKGYVIRAKKSPVGCEPANDDNPEIPEYEWSGRM